MGTGSIYLPDGTKPLPQGAELFDRKGQAMARWVDPTGRIQTAAVTVPKKGKNAGKTRIKTRSKVYVAKYRAADGRLRIVSTGCRHEDMARAVLCDLLRRTELVKAKVLSPAEDAAGEHANLPLENSIKDYVTHLRAKGVTADHEYNVKRQLRMIAKECRFDRLGDLDRVAVERWLVRQAQGDKAMGARTRNTYLSALSSFTMWCVRAGRLVTNPIAGVPRADEGSDPRRVRRSLTVEELTRLLYVAKLRPLADYGRPVLKKKKEDVKSKRGTWSRGELSFSTFDAAAIAGRKALAKNIGYIAELERCGWERSLIYKTLVLTGLRRNELASLTVGSLRLDTPTPFFVLKAKDEKNRVGSELPVRPDLVFDLQEWLGHKLTLAKRQAARNGKAEPTHLPASTPLFTVPVELVKILDRDMVAASIPKVDERGYVVDVHALRHTFGTLLSRGGVSLRTAQAAMRHSDPSLTANVYTDPKLLDVGAALNALPTLPPCGPETQPMKATGTDHGHASDADPSLCCGLYKLPSIGGKMGQTLSKQGGGVAGSLSLVSVAGVNTKVGPDNCCQTAGDRIRTDDVQLGKLAFYH
jgi:integrase